MSRKKKPEAEVAEAPSIPDEDRHQSLEHTLPPTGAYPGPTEPEVYEFDKGHPKTK